MSSSKRPNTGQADQAPPPKKRMSDNYDEILLAEEPLAGERAFRIATLSEVIQCLAVYVFWKGFSGTATATRVPHALTIWRRMTALRGRLNEFRAVDVDNWHRNWPKTDARGLEWIVFGLRLQNKFASLRRIMKNADFEAHGIKEPWDMPQDPEYADAFLDEYIYAGKVCLTSLFVCKGA